MSTAHSQSITSTTTPELVNARVPGIVQNILAAQRRVDCDDLTSRFFENAISSVEMLVAEVQDLHNIEVDNFNELVESYENAQLQIGMKKQEIEQLSLKIEHIQRQKQEDIDDAIHESETRAINAEQLATELQGSLNELTVLLGLRNQQLSTLNQAHKEIMKLDPHGLEKRYAKAKKERQDARKQVADLSQQVNKLTKDLSEARSAYAKQKKETTILVEEVTKFRTLQKEMYGITEQRFTSCKEHPTLGYLTFYPRLLAYGVSTPKQYNSERPYIVTKLDFAYQFCCDMGFSLDIRINEWLMPNFQPLRIFEEFQPEGWIEFFHEMICREMEGRRPELVRRVEWAQEVILSESDIFSDHEILEELVEKGFVTLFDVVTRRYEQLVKVCGVSENTARRALDLCYARVDEWEKSNGGVIYVR